MYKPQFLTWNILLELFVDPPKENIREGLQRLDNSISLVSPKVGKIFIIGDLIINLIKQYIQLYFLICLVALSWHKSLINPLALQNDHSHI